MPAPYLENIKKQFAYCKKLGDSTFEQIDDHALFWQFNPESNSIAIIVKHIWGNLMSRWTDFLTTDGEKDFRNRDSEFEATIKTRIELLEKWEEGWTTLFETMDTLEEDDLSRIVYIRNMGHTVAEAINRQLAHNAYHIGQIVYIGRMVAGARWKSLSIPKGQSRQYNEIKFAQPKHNQHFTDEFLEDTQ